ncbi:MAG: ATP-dependent Clp protease adaptor ClpS [Candidatus Kariarchaeaceae archaeon]|jgi:ATP-dependent Clp protease adaptor protein ClpS
MPKKQKDILVKDRQKIDRPKKYKVVLFNDDFTPMELVTLILMSVFNKGRPEAESIMMRVHRQGKGVAGVYSKEIAETKTETAKVYARDAGYPLHAEAEPE